MSEKKEQERPLEPKKEPIKKEEFTDTRKKRELNEGHLVPPPAPDKKKE